MNKKFLSAILFGALMVTSTGTFVSCKDYDDDIDEINKELSDIKSQLSALQTKVDGGKYVTNVVKNGDGITVTWNDNSTSTIETIKGDKGDKGDVVEITIDPTTKNWLIDGKDTGVCAEGKNGAAANDGVSAKSPSIDPATGNWVVYAWNADKKEYVGTDTGVSAKGASAYVTEGANEYVLHVATDKTGAEYTEVKLPKHALIISELEFVGYTMSDGTFVPFQKATDNNAGQTSYVEDHNKYIMPYSAFYFAADSRYEFVDADKSQKYEETIVKKTAISTLAGASLVVRVAPANADLSAYDLSLVNSKLGEAPIKLETAEPFSGLITRASSANGLWSVPMTSQIVKGVESAADFDKNFRVDAGQIAFAVKASNVDFVSNFNLVFNKIGVESPEVKLNGIAQSTGNINYNENTGFKIKLNAVNTFSTTNPTSVYKTQVIVDELYKERWGVKIEGNTFQVTNFYDKQTVPAFPVYFWHYDLTTQTAVKTTVYVQLENSISDMTTLSEVNWTIPTAANKDNFTASLAAMFSNLGTAGTEEWKDRVNSVATQVYQVGTNADGSDKAVSGAGLVQFLNANNGVVDVNTTANIKTVAKVKVNLNHQWPADANHALDKKYYVKVDFKASNGDVLNSVKLPFTVAIPAMSNLFKEQAGVFVNGVANAYMDATATTGNVAPEYYIKGAFETFKANLGTSTFNINLDNQTKISGEKKSVDLAELSATAINGANAEELKITLKTAGVTINANGTPEGYKKELIAVVSDVKYLNRYSYGNATYTFKIKVMSPILEGNIQAVGGEVIVPATDLDGYMVNDSHIKGYTYNSIVYSISMIKLLSLKKELIMLGSVKKSKA